MRQIYVRFFDEDPLDNDLVRLEAGNTLKDLTAQIRKPGEWALFFPPGDDFCDDRFKPWWDTFYHHIYEDGFTACAVRESEPFFRCLCGNGQREDVPSPPNQ